MAASYPVVIYQPFADTGDKNVIPNTPSPTPGLASYEDGFPPITRIKIQLGGKPPAGKDFNGVLNDITQHTLWNEAGGRYKFDATFATTIGGYSKGMILQDNGGTTDYISLVNNNSVNFNTTPTSIGVQWGVYAGAAAGNSVTTITTTGGTVTLSANQAASDIIVVNGALASASTIVFPATIDSWKLINSTSGAFSMVAKAPSGQSLTMSQGFTNTVFYDGTQLQFPDHDSGLDSPAFRGNPTVPTQTPLTNNTRAANTAYVDAAVSTGLASSTPQYISANFNAGATGDLWCNTTAASFTITLPDPPFSQNILQIRDIAGMFATNNLIINPQTKNINGVPGSMNCDVNGIQFGLWYNGTEWRLV